MGDWTLDHALPLLEQAAGAPVRGLVDGPYAVRGDLRGGARRAVRGGHPLDDEAQLLALGGGRPARAGRAPRRAGDDDRAGGPGGELAGPAVTESDHVRIATCGGLAPFSRRCGARGTRGPVGAAKRVRRGRDQGAGVGGDRPHRVHGAAARRSLALAVSRAGRHARCRRRGRPAVRRAAARRAADRAVHGRAPSRSPCLPGGYRSRRGGPRAVGRLPRARQPAVRDGDLSGARGDVADRGQRTPTARVPRTRRGARGGDRRGAGGAGAGGRRRGAGADRARAARRDLAQRERDGPPGCRRRRRVCDPPRAFS